MDFGKNVVARFDMNGVKGFIQFYQPHAGAPVTISVELWGLDEYHTETYGWHIHDFPIYYPGLNRFPCSDKYLGGIYDPLGVSADPDYEARCAANATDCAVGDLVGRLEPIKAKRQSQVFVDETLDLCGPLSPIGRSVVIHRMGAGGRWVCGNIDFPIAYPGARVQVAKYVFKGAFMGEILFRRAEGVSKFETFLFASDNITTGMNLNQTRWSLRHGTCAKQGPVCSRWNLLLNEI